MEGVVFCSRSSAGLGLSEVITEEKHYFKKFLTSQNLHHLLYFFVFLKKIVQFKTVWRDELCKAQC